MKRIRATQTKPNRGTMVPPGTVLEIGPDIDAQAARDWIMAGWAVDADAEPAAASGGGSRAAAKA